jgi:hypothetical protein
MAECDRQLNPYLEQREGRKPTMARLTLARKIAAITLIVWKKEVRFDANYLKPQAAWAPLAESLFHPGEPFPGGGRGLLRRAISRGSRNRRSQARALRTRVSVPTLCPLGQSKKAIGPESPIGPCIATPRVDKRPACCVSEKRRRRHNREMELPGRTIDSPVHMRRRRKIFHLGKTTPRVRVYVG